MTALVYVAAFCIVAVLVYMARYSGRLRVTHTRLIDASLAEVRDRVVDLRRWRDWNPWLENEAGAHAVYSSGADGIASACAWSRAGVDISRVESLRVREGATIEQRVRLWQPFPFRGRCSWQFIDAQGKTQATWRLRGRVAFPMRAFAATVQGSIALDFRYGLDRLAALVEPAGAPRYSLSRAGVREIAAMRYAYVAHEGPIQGLGNAIASAVGTLRTELARQGVMPLGEPIGVYVKTDIKRRTTLCRFGVPVDAAEIEGLAMASLPAHRAFVNRLQGSRAQLEVAWYLAMQRLSAEGLQPDLRIAPFERYLDIANQEDDNDAVTELHIPVR